MTLTAWGLLADLIGVLVVAFSTPQVSDWAGTLQTRVGAPWEEDAQREALLRKTANRIGWTLIVGGFALQLYAEVGP